MQPSTRERPVETFPIQCHACADIFDVAADVDEQSDCPMCGASVLVAEAEEFELDCPDGFVIEELTPTCLRFRQPRPPKWMTYAICLGFVVVAIPLLICVVHSIMTVPQKSLTQTIESNFAGSMLVLYSLAISVLILAGLIVHSTTELTNEHFKSTYHVRSIRCFTQRLIHSATPDVCMIGTEFCVSYQSKRKVRALAFKRDTARYITHLIRRQLKTMGHELHNGRS